MQACAAIAVISSDNGNKNRFLELNALTVVKACMNNKFKTVCIRVLRHQ